MSSITRIQLDSWSPCYDSDEIDRIVGDQERLTPLQVLDLDISIADRFWVLLRPEVVPERELRLLAADFAEHVAHLWISPDGCDWTPAQTLDVVRRFAEGTATREELSAAWDIAWDARAVAWGAAAAAAGDAAWGAWDAAGAAAGAARTATTGAAAGAAWSGATAAGAARGAGGAEREWQLAKLREYLSEPL